MNLDQVRQFRTAAFQEDVVDDFAVAFTAKFETSAQAAFERVVRVLDPKGKTAAAHFLEGHDEHISIETTALQVELLAFIDELRLVEFGYTQDYYSATAYDDAVTYMMRHDSLTGYEVLRPIGDFLMELRPFWRNGIQISRNSIGLYDNQVDFNDVLFTWRDTATEGFFECARLLMFAGAAEWAARSSQLAAVATRLSAEPSLSITPQEASEIEWGLHAAEPFFDQDADGVRWSSTYSTVDRMVARNPDRLLRLGQIRSEIAQSAHSLTTDESTAALRRSIRTAEDPRTFSQ